MYRLRAAEEHVEHRLAELAIVPDDLWARVQARVSANRKTGGRPAGASKHPLLLSGLSEALVAQLRREEGTLRDLRNRLAAAERDAKPRPAPATVNPEKLAKYLRHVEKLAEEAPESARAALARVLAPVMLHPVEKGGKRSYEARGALKIDDPVSLSGDRVLDKVGCGGAPRSKADLLQFAPALPSRTRT